MIGSFVIYEKKYAAT